MDIMKILLGLETHLVMAKLEEVSVEPWLVSLAVGTDQRRIFACCVCLLVHCVM